MKLFSKRSKAFLTNLLDSGLDSSSSTYTIRLLHNLAREGRTIVCTIHQPSASIYEMFDHVYVLAEGHCVYQGSNANTVPYLASLGLQCPQYHSAADYLLEVANGEYGNFNYQLAKAAISEQWRTSTTTVYIRDDYDNNSERNVDGISNDTDEKRISVYTKTSDNVSGKLSLKPGIRITPSEWTRLWVLISRCNILLFRDWTVTHLKLFLHVVCAILIGFYFGDSGVNAHKSISNIGFLLINVVYLWWEKTNLFWMLCSNAIVFRYTTMMPGVLRFPAEISILRKEVFNNWYKLRTYYLATIITSTPIHVRRSKSWRWHWSFIDFLALDAFCDRLCDDRLLHYRAATRAWSILQGHDNLCSCDGHCWWFWNLTRNFS